MSGVNPVASRKESLLDTIMKGVAIARDVYGIKSGMDENDAKEEERDRVKKERDRLAAGKLNKGEQIELGTKGFVAAPSGKPADFTATDDASGGVLGYVKKQTAPVVTAPKVVGNALVTQDPKTGEWKPVYEAPHKGGDGGGIKPPPHMQVGGSVLQWDQAKGAWEPVYTAPEKPAKDITVNERNTLQTQYNHDPEVKKNKAVLQSYSEVQSIMQDTSPAADLTLIYAYMKALDPGSVVRESEAESAQALGSLMERAKAKLSQMNGGGRLTDSQRADMVRQVEKLAKNSAGQLGKLEESYRAHAGRRSVDAQDLMFAPRPTFTDAAPPAQPTASKATPAAPTMPNAEDAAALEWLKNNPNDPRAPAMREKLKLKGL